MSCVLVELRHFPQTLWVLFLNSTRMVVFPILMVVCLRYNRHYAMFMMNLSLSDVSFRVQIIIFCIIFEGHCTSSNERFVNTLLKWFVHVVYLLRPDYARDSSDEEDEDEDVFHEQVATHMDQDQDQVAQVQRGMSIN